MNVGYIMTNELEKTFFDTFGIRAYYKYLLIDKTSRCHNEKLFDKQNFIDFIKSGKDYLLLKVIKYPPQITDSILLELICIAHTSPVIAFVSRDVKSLRKEVLMVLCNWVNNRNIKQQVQALFKEEK